MSMRSEESKARRAQKRELKRRRRAIEHKHFSLATRCGIAARRYKQKAANLHRRRVGAFRSSMLDGHPGNIADDVKRFIALAYKFADERGYVCTVTATTNGTHATGSYHYVIAGRNKLGWAVDLIFATVAQMEEFQHYAADHTPGKTRDFRELFGPAGFYLKDGSTVLAHFPDHGDHLHGAPEPSFRR